MRAAETGVDQETESKETNGASFAFGSPDFTKLVNDNGGGSMQRIRETEDGAELICGMQDITAEVSAAALRIVSTSDSADNDAFELRLLGYGRSEELIPTGIGGVAVQSEKNTAFVNRATVSESISVSIDGVRQDFIVRQKPAGAGDLRLAIRVIGATAYAADTGAMLCLPGGRQLTYNRLKATDATGSVLPARMDVSPEEIVIVVEDENAEYPLYIDPTITDSNWEAVGDITPRINGAVYSIVEYNGDIIIGGAFSTISGMSVNYIARWNGTSWSSLGIGMNNTVYALAVSGTDLYAGGIFTIAGGVSVNRIAKWNGESWSALGIGVSGTVYSIQISGTDLYAGGEFTTAGAVTVNRIAKWDGTSWSALGIGVDSTVRAISLSSTALYIGGYFTNAGGMPANRVAKWDGASW
ncbi:MAG: hypothetical protein ABIH86_05920, partial [Planctomycetota bacterium]